jgi:Protein of unknown function (DUF3810)
MSRLLRWIAPLVLLTVAICLQRLAAQHPQAVDRIFSGGLYLHVGRLLSAVNRSLPFSIAEVLILALPVLLLLVVLRVTWKQIQRGMNVFGIVAAGVRALLWFAGGGFLLFLLLWGLNYQRLPAGKVLGLSERTASREEIETISRTIIAEINSNWESARGAADWSQGSRLALSRAQLYDLIELTFQREELLGKAREPVLGPPKPVYFSRILSRLGISGIFSPFTGEPNFNAEQPDSELPFAMAHEKAHQRGFAREDEANFIAFLICTKAENAYVRYSGFLRTLRVLTALREAVPDDRYREIVAALGAGPRADLRTNFEFWRSSRSRFFGDAAERANDSYLRANRVTSGVRNYGEVVTLILNYYVTYPPRVLSPEEHLQSR